MKGKKLFALLLALMMIFTLVPGMAALAEEEVEIVEAEAPLAMLAPTAAAVEQTIYLKGTGSNFTETWQNVFYLGGTANEDGEDNNIWHLVYTGNNVDLITEMQLVFTNDEVFKWDPSMGFSTNKGGNNPGWVVVAPYDWVLDYVSSGNNNVSDCFVVTGEGGNIQFNISGFHKGSGGKTDPYGELVIGKTVDGIDFAAWVSDNYDGDLDELMAGISFELYRANDYGTDYDGPVIKTASLQDTLFEGTIFAFGSIELETPAWYAVVEVFVPGSDAEELFQDIGPQYFYISGKDADGKYLVSGGATFDYDVLYTIVNGYNNQYIKTLGYPGLNNSGDIFYIGVKNSVTGEEYPSYCAHAGSKNFAGDNSLGCIGYMVAKSFVEIESKNAVDFISAYNYIEDTYGTLNDNRVITQVVTWILLNAIDINFDEFAAANLTETEFDAIIDVVENYQGYTGKGAIKDLVYMVCENPNHNFDFCQPQLVPIYGSGVFDNKPNDPIDPYGDISFFKKAITANGTVVDAEEGQFSFKLWKLDDSEDGSDEYDIPVNRIDADGNVIGDNTYEVEETIFGGLVQAKGLAVGKYVFIEDAADGWALVDFQDGLFFEVVLNADGKTTKTVYTDNDGNVVDWDLDNPPVITNTGIGKLTISASALLKTSKQDWWDIWQGEKTPYKVLSAKTDSTTLTNAGYQDDPSFTFDSKNNSLYSMVVPGSNHFCFATLDKAALLAGEVIDLALVNGSKIDQVGTATVKAYTIDGDKVTQLEITIKDLASGSTYGFVAADGFLPYAKNSNIQSLGIFKTGASFIVDVLDEDSYQDKDKKAGNYDKDWADITGKNAIKGNNIYLYMHANPIQFDYTKYEETFDGEYAWETIEPRKIGEGFGEIVYATKSLNIFVKVYDEDGVLVDKFTLNGNKATTGAKTLTLPAGDYTVEWTFDYDGDTDTYSDSVTVLPGQTVKFPHINASYEEPTEMIYTGIKYADPLYKINPPKTVTKNYMI